MNSSSDLRMFGSQHMISCIWDGPQRRDDTHVVQVREIACSNHCLTVREKAEECYISIGSCQDILMIKLEMHRVVPKFVP
jgi:hypothetical protein